MYEIHIDARVSKEDFDKIKSTFSFPNVEIVKDQMLGLHAHVSLVYIEFIATMRLLSRDPNKEWTHVINLRYLFIDYHINIVVEMISQHSHLKDWRHFYGETLPKVILMCKIVMDGMKDELVHYGLIVDGIHILKLKTIAYFITQPHHNESATPITNPFYHLPRILSILNINNY